MDAAGVALLFWIAVGAVGGAAIGKMARNQPRAGLVLGLLLGVLGWLLVVFLPDCRPRCPHCRGLVQADAKKCEHCGGDLNAAKPAPPPLPEQPPPEDPSKITGTVRWVSDNRDGAGYAAVIESAGRFAFLTCLTSDEAAAARSRLEQPMTFDRLAVRKLLPDRAASVAEIRSFLSAAK